ncbi:hypothetical protein [Melittangium boletus]|nr:hypothetical protein [Melittangium boletus]
MRNLLVPMLMLALACVGRKPYYLHTELPKLEDDPDLAIAPGPWKTESVLVVLSDSASVPDDLVIPALKALMALPGATDACDPNTGHPRPDAAEYCIALYRTPEDWRVSWPIRNLTGEHNSCQPPFGGVDDEDFGRDLPILGFAHNHPCGTNMSSPDLSVFPKVKAGEGLWVMVAYGASPSGKLLRDVRGELLPAWHWLATGQPDRPRFYRWDPEGKVFRWNEASRIWDFQATCQPRSASMLSPRALSPHCSPALDW